MILRTNKKKMVFLFLVNLIFIAANIALLHGDGITLVVGWLGILLFGVCNLVLIYQLITGAGKLFIDSNGITMTTLFKPLKLAWSEVDGFYVGYIHRTKFIVIKYAASGQKHRLGRKISSKISSLVTGIEDSLLVTNRFTRPAEEVCDLLNRAKIKWYVPGIDDLRQSKDAEALVIDPGIFAYIDEGFVINLKEAQYSIPWVNVQAIFGYKEDLVTMDEICLDIFCDNNISFKITEETPGWCVFLEKIGVHFPSIKKGWSLEITLTPFARNLMLVYERENRALSRAVDIYYKK